MPHTNPKVASRRVARFQARAAEPRRIANGADKEGGPCSSNRQGCLSGSSNCGTRQPRAGAVGSAQFSQRGQARLDGNNFPKRGIMFPPSALPRMTGPERHYVMPVRGHGEKPAKEQPGQPLDAIRQRLPYTVVNARSSCRAASLNSFRGSIDAPPLLIMSRSSRIVLLGSKKVSIVVCTTLSAHSTVSGRERVRILLTKAYRSTSSSIFGSLLTMA